MRLLRLSWFPSRRQAIHGLNEVSFINFISYLSFFSSSFSGTLYICFFRGEHRLKSVECYACRYSWRQNEYIVQEISEKKKKQFYTRNNARKTIRFPIKQNERAHHATPLHLISEKHPVQSCIQKNDLLENPRFLYQVPSSFFRCPRLAYPRIKIIKHMAPCVQVRHYAKSPPCYFL